MGPFNTQRTRALSLVAVLLMLVTVLAPRAAAASNGTLGSPPYTEYNWDTNGNGLANWLVVNVTVSVTTGGIFRVEGFMLNGSTLVAAASNQTSLLLGPRTVKLLFYGGEIRNSRQAGLWVIATKLFNDMGTQIDSKSGAQSFHNWWQYDDAEASIAESATTRYDSDRDGLFNWVNTSVRLQVNTSGTYTLLASISAGGSTLTTDNKQEVLGVGLHNLTVHFSGPSINYQGINGPYTITLFLSNATGVLQDLRFSTTPNWSAAQFDPPRAAFNPPYSYYILDIDNDGKADILVVNVTLQIFDGANFTIQGVLWDGTHTKRITSAQNLTGGSRGTNVTVQLWLSGYAINRSGLDSPYWLDLSLDDELYGYTGSASFTITPWTHNDFERPPATFAPPHASYLRDTDGDGKGNVLEVNATISVVKGGGFSVVGIILGNNRFLAAAQVITEKSPGTYAITLKFSGPQLQLGGVPGPYNVTLGLYYLPAGHDFLSLETDQGYHVTSAYSLSQIQTATPATILGKVTRASDGAPVPGVEVDVANYADAFLTRVKTNSTGDFIVSAYGNSFTALADGPQDLQDQVDSFAVSGTTTHDWSLAAAPRDDTQGNVTFSGGWNSAALDFNVTKRSENQSIRFNVDALQNLDGVMQQSELDTFLTIIGLTFFPADSSKSFTVDGTVFNLRSGSGVEDFNAAGPVTSTRPLWVTGNATYDALAPVALAPTHRINTTYEYPGATEVLRDTFQFTGNYALQSYATAGNVSLSGLGSTKAVATVGQDPNPADSLKNAWVNMTVKDDVQAPAVSGNTAVPNPQEFIGPVNLSAVVTDDVYVAQVKVQVSDPLGAFVGNFSMSYDGVSGRYYYQVPSASLTQLGTYVYTLWAKDGVGRTSSKGGTFVVQDTTAPTIVFHSDTPDPQEIHGDVNVTAVVADNYQVSVVKLEVRNPDVTLLGNFTMLFDGSTWYYQRTYDLLGTYSYTLWAQDTKGNLKSLTDTFVVRDTTSPVISPPSAPASTEVPATVNITAVITDNDRVALVFIEVHDPSGAFVFNRTMTFDASSGKYYYVFSCQAEGRCAVPGDYTFSLWASDPSDNHAKVTGTFGLTDTTPPVVAGASASPASPEVFTPTNITAMVTDNSGSVTAVKVEVFDPLGARVGNFSMVRDASTGRYYYIFTPSLLGTYSYNLWAKDGIPNTRRATGTFTSVDTTAPVASAGPDRGAERASSLTLDASGSSDNYGIRNYTWSFLVGSQLVKLYGQSVSYTFGTSGTYTLTLTVTDFSGNVATDLVVVTVTDTVRPSTPAVPSAVQGETSGTILLTWTAVSDSDVAGYNVYRADGPTGSYVKVNIGLVAGTSYTDKGLADGTTYYYRVTAVDKDGNESPQSTTSSGATKPAFYSPTTPMGLGLWLGLIAVVGALVGAGLRKHRRGGPKGPSEAEGKGETPSAPPEGASDVGQATPPPPPEVPTPEAPLSPDAPTSQPTQTSAPPPPANAAARSEQEDEALLLIMRGGNSTKPKERDKDLEL